MRSSPHRSKRIAATILAVVCAPVLITASSVRAAHPSVLKRMVAGAETAHPNALWHIVHGLCVRDMRTSGNPAPCVDVNLAGGYAVLKDIEHKTQYLLVPTTRVSGIESPDLLTPGSPNYWQAAWSARRFLEQQVGRAIPREDIGLAVNSVLGRTQNQLHIHIDCVKPGVRRILDARRFKISSRWSNLGVSGRHYRVRWISGPDLGATDPFKLLARGDPAARADMGRETLVLIGASRPDGRPGFLLLNDQADLGADDVGAGEELLDHRCQILSERPASVN